MNWDFVPDEASLRTRERSFAISSEEGLVEEEEAPDFWWGRSWRDGRKKGAFSGFLGASVGLFLWRIRSRWRRFCHLERGTRERERRSAGRVSSSDAGSVSRSMAASSSSASDSCALAAMRFVLPSPEAVGADVVVE